MDIALIEDIVPITRRVATTHNRRGQSISSSDRMPPLVIYPKIMVGGFVELQKVADGTGRQCRRQFFCLYPKAMDCYKMTTTMFLLHYSE